MEIGEPPVELIVAVLQTSPLRLHVSLHNPDSNDAEVWVPRTLRPLGAFVRLRVRTLAGEVVFETTEPKLKRKLDPASDASYVALDPGYSFGAVLETDLGGLQGGAYLLTLTYTNGDYTGTPQRAVGDLALAEELEVDVADG